MDDDDKIKWIYISCTIFVISFMLGFVTGELVAERDYLLIQVNKQHTTK